MKVLSIFITAIIILNISTPVMGSGLLASPTMFQYKLTDSNTGSGQLFVKNIGDDEVDVTVNKKRLLKDNIHLDFSDNGIANWITLNSPTNFTLKPGETKILSFTITAPDKFNYNDAVGALVIKGVPKPLNKSNSDVPKVTIQQAVELVIPIVVGLPGPIIESLQLLEHSAPTVLISYMPGDFTYHVKNNGTVYANMTGNIEIKGC